MPAIARKRTRRRRRVPNGRTDKTNEAIDVPVVFQPRGSCRNRSWSRCGRRENPGGEGGRAEGRRAEGGRGEAGRREEAGGEARRAEGWRTESRRGETRRAEAGRIQAQD